MTVFELLPKGVGFDLKFLEHQQLWILHLRYRGWTTTAAFNIDPTTEIAQCGTLEALKTMRFAIYDEAVSRRGGRPLVYLGR
jgi:hypothetical protein